MRYVPQLALAALDVPLKLFHQHTLLDLVVAYDCTHFLTTHCSKAIDIQLYGDMEVRDNEREEVAGAYPLPPALVCLRQF